MDLAELIRRHHIPGAQLTVLDGEHHLEYAAGVLNGRTGHAVTPESLFLPGSIGKVYTATVVMSLVDEGGIELDAPVGKYLAVDHDATIRQLLTHTSGLDGDRLSDTGRGDDCLERYVAGCADLGRIAAPGALWSYSNAGYAMLGRVVEVVTGSVWETVLRERIIAPLGLAHTVLFPEEALLHAAAAGHQDGEVVPQWCLSRACGPMGASIIASASDVIAFARAHVDGTFPFAAPMQEEHIRLVDPFLLGRGWGLGWILDEWDGVRIIGHDGNSFGQNAFLRIAPEHGFAMCLQTNVGSAMRLYRELAASLFGERLGVAPPPLPVATSRAVDPDAIAGVYEREGLRIEIGRDLTATLSVVGTDAFPLRPVDDRTFLVRPPIIDDDLTMVFFNPDDPAGRPTHLHFGGRASVRV